MQENVLLRTRHRNAVFPEEPPKLEQNFALDVMDAIVRVSDPEPELKLDRTTNLIPIVICTAPRTP